MERFNRLTMYGFADFYHRFASTGLTMDEMLLNYMKYKKEPRDIGDPIKLPTKLREEVLKLKPPHTKLREVLKYACQVGQVTQDDVNSKARNREFVTVRQWVSYVGMNMGFEPMDFQRILGWERSGIYHKTSKAEILASTDMDYCVALNEILRVFGLEPINA